MPDDVLEETRLSGLIRSKGFVIKSALSDIMKWKFEGMGHALPTQLRHVRVTDAEVIEKTTRRALTQGLADIERTRILEELTGVGPKVASVILTFWNPAEYGVFDFHAWNALAAEKYIKPAHEGTSEEYVEEFLPTLQKLAVTHRMAVRELEKAYYYKDVCKG